MEALSIDSTGQSSFGMDPFEATDKEPVLSQHPIDISGQKHDETTLSQHPIDVSVGSGHSSARDFVPSHHRVEQKPDATDDLPHTLSQHLSHSHAVKDFTLSQHPIEGLNNSKHAPLKDFTLSQHPIEGLNNSKHAPLKDTSLSQHPIEAPPVLGDFTLSQHPIEAPPILGDLSQHPIEAPPILGDFTLSQRPIEAPPILGDFTLSQHPIEIHTSSSDSLNHQSKSSTPSKNLLEAFNNCSELCDKDVTQYPLDASRSRDQRSLANFSLSQHPVEVWRTQPIQGFELDSSLSFAGTREHWLTLDPEESRDQTLHDARSQSELRIVATSKEMASQETSTINASPLSTLPPSVEIQSTQQKIGGGDRLKNDDRSEREKTSVTVEVTPFLTGPNSDAADSGRVSDGTASAAASFARENAPVRKASMYDSDGSVVTSRSLIGQHTSGGSDADTRSLLSESDRFLRQVGVHAAPPGGLAARRIASTAASVDATERPGSVGVETSGKGRQHGRVADSDASSECSTQIGSLFSSRVATLDDATLDDATLDDATLDDASRRSRGSVHGSSRRGSADEAAERPRSSASRASSRQQKGVENASTGRTSPQRDASRSSKDSSRGSSAKASLRGSPDLSRSGSECGERGKSTALPVGPPGGRPVAGASDSSDNDARRRDPLGSDTDAGSGDSMSRRVAALLAPPVDGADVQRLVSEFRAAVGSGQQRPLPAVYVDSRRSSSCESSVCGSVSEIEDALDRDVRRILAKYGRALSSDDDRRSRPTAGGTTDAPDQRAARPGDTASGGESTTSSALGSTLGRRVRHLLSEPPSFDDADVVVAGSNEAAPRRRVDYDRLEKDLSEIETSLASLSERRDSDAASSTASRGSHRPAAAAAAAAAARQPHPLLTGGVVPIAVALDIVSASDYFDRLPRETGGHRSLSVSSFEDLPPPCGDAEDARSPAERDGSLHRIVSSQAETSGDKFNASFSAGAPPVDGRFQSPYAGLVPFSVNDGCEEAGDYAVAPPIGESADASVDVSTLIREIMERESPSNQAYELLRMADLETLGVSGGGEPTPVVSPAAPYTPFNALASTMGLFSTQMERATKAAFDRSAERTSPHRRHLEEGGRTTAVQARALSPIVNTRQRRFVDDSATMLSTPTTESIKNELRRTRASPELVRSTASLPIGRLDTDLVSRVDGEDTALTGRLDSISVMDDGAIDDVSIGPLGIVSHLEDGGRLERVASRETLVTVDRPRSVPIAVVRDDLHDDLHDNLRGDLRDDLRDNLRGNLHDDLRGDLRVACEKAVTQLNEAREVLEESEREVDRMAEQRRRARSALELSAPGKRKFAHMMEQPHRSKSALGVVRREASRSMEQPAVELSGRHERPGSEVNRSKETNRQPYEARGRDRYESRADNWLDDGGSSVTPSEVTVESTHASSDEARAPVFPMWMLGSREDNPVRSAGIYSRLKSPAEVSEKLGPIAEGSFEAESVAQLAARQGAVTADLHRSIRQTQHWLTAGRDVARDVVALGASPGARQRDGFTSSASSPGAGGTSAISDLLTEPEERSMSRGERSINRDGRSGNRVERSAERNEQSAGRGERSVSHEERSVSRDNRSANRNANANGNSLNRNMSANGDQSSDGSEFYGDAPVLSLVGSPRRSGEGGGSRGGGGGEENGGGTAFGTPQRRSGGPPARRSGGGGREGEGKGPAGRIRFEEETDDRGRNIRERNDRETEGRRDEARKRRSLGAEEENASRERQLSGGEGKRRRDVRGEGARRESAPPAARSEGGHRSGFTPLIPDRSDDPLVECRPVRRNCIEDHRGDRRGDRGLDDNYVDRSADRGLDDHYVDRSADCGLDDHYVDRSADRGLDDQYVDRSADRRGDCGLEDHYVDRSTDHQGDHGMKDRGADRQGKRGADNLDVDHDADHRGERGMKDRGMDRQKDRGIDRQKDRGVDRQTDHGDQQTDRGDRQTDRGMDRHTDRDVDRQTDHGDRQTDRGVGRKTDRGVDHQTDRGENRQTDRGEDHQIDRRDRGEDRQTDRSEDRQTDHGEDRKMDRGDRGEDRQTDLSEDRQTDRGDHQTDRGDRLQRLWDRFRSHRSDSSTTRLVTLLRDASATYWQSGEDDDGDTLGSIPEDSASSGGGGGQWRHLPADPKLLRLQRRVARQREAYRQERRREKRRRERLLRGDGGVRRHAPPTEASSLSSVTDTSLSTSSTQTGDTASLTMHDVACRVVAGHRRPHAATAVKTRDFGATCPSPVATTTTQRNVTTRGTQTSPAVAETRHAAVTPAVAVDNIRQLLETTNQTKADRVRASQVGLSWYVPLSDPRPWKRPLAERHQNAVTMETSQRDLSDGVTIESVLAELRLKREADAKSRPQITLQEAFDHRKQRFVSQSRQRQRHLVLRSAERRVQQTERLEREHLFAAVTPPPPPQQTGGATRRGGQTYCDQLYQPKKRSLSKNEVQRRLRRVMKQANEANWQQKEQKRQAAIITNRLRAKLYAQKVLNHLLHKRAPWVEA